MRKNNTFYFLPNYLLGDLLLAAFSFRISFLRTLPLLVGASFLAPTFLLSQAAHAQVGNEQSRLLLEVQQMRQEIAELRDIVDRQSYQLKKLKLAQSSAVPTQQVNQALVAPQLSQGQLPQATLPQTQLPPGQLPQSTVAYGQAAIPATVSDPLPSSAQGAPSLPQPTLSQPNYGAQVIRSNNNNEVDLSGVAPKAATDNASSSQRQYPPVIDRSVSSGGSYPAEGSYPNQALPSASSASSDGYVSANDIVPSAAPRVVSIPTGPITPATNTGVIAVPSAVPQVPSVVQAPSSVSVPSVAQTPVAVPQSILPEQDYYQQGFALLKQSRHEEAVSVFTQQIKAHPQGDFADDAYYWIAESMYVNRKLDVAKTNFSTILNNYKQSPRVPDAMLKIAYIEQDQGNKIEARLLLQDIMQYHPSSNAAISAKNRLAQLK